VDDVIYFNGQIVAVHRDQNSTYDLMIRDRLGSASGALTVSVFDYSWSVASPGPNYSFQGKYGEESLVYFGARYYDDTPNINGGSMRWISVDPVMSRIYDPQSLNRYTYVRNDPVNFIDPDGRSIWGALSAIGSAVWGGIRSIGSGFDLLMDFMWGAVKDWYMYNGGSTSEEYNAIQDAVISSATGPLGSSHSQTLSETQAHASTAVFQGTCLTFLNRVMATISVNASPGEKERYIVGNLAGALLNATYVLDANTSSDPKPNSNQTIGQYLTSHSDTLALVSTGNPNTVYLNNSFYNYSNPVSVLIHEAFHTVVTSGNDYLGGFGATDEELARAAGVYTNANNASVDFLRAISNNCN